MALSGEGHLTQFFPHALACLKKRNKWFSVGVILSWMRNLLSSARIGKSNAEMRGLCCREVDLPVLNHCIAFLNMAPTNFVFEETELGGELSLQVRVHSFEGCHWEQLGTALEDCLNARSADQRVVPHFL
jgi:hypothetical protein